MATMHLSLPDPMKDWVDAQAESGRYGNAGDYVRDLIRRDQERAAKIGNMQRLVTEAIESGIADETFEEIEAAARRDFLAGASESEL
ncbi:type II toxin-antitoxin system ParD family antitoxin [Jiella sp. M17.18]|uniref:type II toxin-antitoxin system ParD family antitoxin n=1 Tax=Jiella sp. M17.18 TaxID=3234247 RepID=UPI0034DFD6D4